MVHQCLYVAAVRCHGMLATTCAQTQPDGRAESHPQQTCTHHMSQELHFETFNCQSCKQWSQILFPLQSKQSSTFYHGMSILPGIKLLRNTSIDRDKHTHRQRDTQTDRNQHTHQHTQTHTHKTYRHMDQGIFPPS